MTDDRRKNEPKTGRFQPGNPGKPKGARHKTTLLAEKLMQDDAENIVKAVLTAAHNGDMTAARIIIDRIAPARRDNPVSFELPKIESAADAAKVMSAILDAVADDAARAALYDRSRHKACQIKAQHSTTPSP